MSDWNRNDALSIEDQLLSQLFAASAEHQRAKLQQVAESDPQLAARVQELLELDRLASEEDFLALTPPASLADSTLVESMNSPVATALQCLKGRKLGPFTLIRHIASGGMGHVYAAERQQPVRQEVAVKVLRERFCEEARTRFRIESQVLAKLSHPNILPLIDCGIAEEDVSYFVTPLVDGVRIDRYVRMHQSTCLEQAQLILQVCRAVQHAHDHGFIHRDLKPSNILVDSAAQVYVTDFGLAKMLASSEAAADQTAGFSTMKGKVLGTPKFLPPEHLNASDNLVSVRTDVYGIGATLYAIITGRAPHEADSIAESLLKAKTQIPPPMRQLVPSVPKDLETICQKCLEIRPDSRYRSAAELADDLQRFAQGEPIHARRVSIWEHGWRWAKRNRTAASLLGTTIATVLISVCCLAVLLEQAQTSQKREALERERSRKLANQFLDATADALFLLPAQSSERLKLQQRVAEVLREFVAEAPTDRTSKRDYAVAQYKLSETEMLLGNEDRGLQALLEARATFTELSRQNPDDLQVLFDLAHSQIRMNESSNAYRTLKLVMEMPKTNKFHRNALASVCSSFAIGEARHGRTKFALQVLSEGIALAQSVRSESDDRGTSQPVDFLKPLGENYHAQAIVLWHAGRLQEARRVASEAVTIAEQLLDRNIERPEFLEYAVNWRITQAWLAFDDRDFEIAAQVGTEALKLADQYVEARSDWRSPVEFRFKANALLAEVLLQNDDNLAAGFEHQALVDMELLLTKFDSWPDAVPVACYFYCGRIRRLHKETESRLRESFQSSLAEDPNLALTLAVADWFEGDYDRSQIHLSQCEAAELQEVGRCLALCLQASLLVEQDRWSEAEPALQTARTELSQVQTFSNRIPWARMNRFLDNLDQSLNFPR